MEMHVPSAVLEARHVPATQPLPSGVALEFSPQLRVSYDRATRAIWSRWTPEPRPCFNPSLLADIRAYYDYLAASGARLDCGGEEQPIEYVVLASGMPGVFNLGGDLALFVLLIKARDRDALAHYARLCIDNMYPRIQNYYCPTLTTISLVQGDALGGGFECAMSSDVLVAEESAQLGLPEILFNLFPGMGAVSLLTRRIGLRAAEELILSGRVLPAAKLHEMGIVDVLARDGEGEAAVGEWIARNDRRRNGMQAVFRARQQVAPITREELDAIADTWVDAALRIEDRDLKMMGRIVRSQMRRMEHGDVDDITAGVAEEALAAVG